MISGFGWLPFKRVSNNSIKNIKNKDEKTKDIEDEIYDAYDFSDFSSDLETQNDLTREDIDYIKEDIPNSSKDSDVSLDHNSDDKFLICSGIYENNGVLDFYIYNTIENNFSFHHDIILKYTPLCLDVIKPSDSCDGYVVVGSNKPLIDFYNYCDKFASKPIYSLKKQKNSSNFHTGSITSIHANYNKLASCSVDSSTSICDVETFKINNFHRFDGKVMNTCIKYKPKQENILVVLDENSNCHKFDSRCFDNLQTFELGQKVKNNNGITESDYTIDAVFWNQKRDWYLYGTDSLGGISCFDQRKDFAIVSYNQLHNDPIFCVDQNSDSKLLVTSSSEKYLKIWKCSGKKVSFKDSIRRPKGEISELKFSKIGNSSIIAYGSKCEKLFVYHVDNKLIVNYDKL